MNDAPMRATPDNNTTGDASEMTFNTAEYPELEGLSEGSPVTVTCQGTVSKSQGGEVTLSITNCDFDTEGQVDRDMRDMSRQESTEQPGGPSVSGDDF